MGKKKQKKAARKNREHAAESWGGRPFTAYGEDGRRDGADGLYGAEAGWSYGAGVGWPYGAGVGWPYGGGGGGFSGSCVMAPP